MGEAWIHATVCTVQYKNKMKESGTFRRDADGSIQPQPRLLGESSV